MGSEQTKRISNPSTVAADARSSMSAQNTATAAVTSASKKSGRGSSKDVRIFLSYRREDSIDASGRLYDSLSSEFGAKSVFFDVDSMAAGHDFRRQFRDYLSACDVVLVVIGKNWLRPAKDGKPRLSDERDFVRIEIEESLRQEIAVIPVLVGDAAMPTAEMLPESIRDLTYRHAVRLRPNPDFRHDVSRLIETVRGRRGRRRTVWLAWLAAGATVLAMCGLVLSAVWISSDADPAPASGPSNDNHTSNVPLDPQLPPRVLTATERAIYDRLDEPTKADFVEMPLSDVVEYTKDVHGIDVLIDPTSLVDLSAPITLSLKKPSLRSMLLAAFDQVNATIVIRHELLYVIAKGDERTDDLGPVPPKGLSNSLSPIEENRLLTKRVNDTLNWGQGEVESDPARVLERLELVREDLHGAVGLESSTREELLTRVDSLFELASRAFENKMVVLTPKIIERAPARMVKEASATIVDLELARDVLERRPERFQSPDKLLEEVNALMVKAHRLSAEQSAALQSQQPHVNVPDVQAPESVQLAFESPEGMHVSWEAPTHNDYEAPPLVVPGRFNFPTGQSVRVALSSIPGYPSVTISPVIEIMVSDSKVCDFLQDNAVPFRLTEDDIEYVSSGVAVIKVLYLPKGELSPVQVAGIKSSPVQELKSTDVDPDVDVLAEAKRRGSIVATIRVGTKK